MAIILIGHFPVAFGRVLNQSKIPVERIEPTSESNVSRVVNDPSTQDVLSNASENDVVVISDDGTPLPQNFRESTVANCLHVPEDLNDGIFPQNEPPSRTDLSEQDWYNVAREVLRFHSRAQLSPADRTQMLSARKQAYEKFLNTNLDDTFHTQHPQFRQFAKVSRPTSPSNRITFFFNGAVDPERAQGKPVFQRTSFFPEIEGTCVSIPDPTQDAFPELRLGWGQGTSEVWGAAVQAGMIEGIIQAWLEKNQITRSEATVQFHGSSAGGFQALMVGSFVRTDRVLANNPQVDVLHYESIAAKKTMATSVYGDGALKNNEVETVVGLNAPTDIYLRKNWNRRLSLVALWSKAGYAPKSWLLVNSQSSTDVQLQMKPLLNFLAGSPGLNLLPELRLELYPSPERQHNPITQQATIDWINSPIEASF